MAKVKVRVLDAVVDGKGAGSELTIDEATAKSLASIGYVELVKEEAAEKAKPKEVAKESALEATKTPSRKAPKSKTKQTSKGGRLDGAIDRLSSSTSPSL